MNLPRSTEYLPRIRYLRMCQFLALSSLSLASSIIEHHRASSSIIEHHRASVATFKTLASACIRPTNSLRSLGSTIWSFYTHIPRISKLEACLQWAKHVALSWWICACKLGPLSATYFECSRLLGRCGAMKAAPGTLQSSEQGRNISRSSCFVHTQDIFTSVLPMSYCLPRLPFIFHLQLGGLGPLDPAKSPCVRPVCAGVC
jgi:hypothetical protein